MGHSAQEQPTGRLGTSEESNATKRSGDAALPVVVKVMSINTSLVDTFASV